MATRENRRALAPEAGNSKIQGESMTANKSTIGYFVQMGGVAAFALGAIFGIHHVALDVAFVGGAAAFYLGEKIRTMA
jgi:hypothetical protein